MHREGHRNTQGDTVMHNFDLWDTHRMDIRTDRGYYIGGAHLKREYHCEWNRPHGSADIEEDSRTEDNTKNQEDNPQEDKFRNNGQHHQEGKKGNCSDTS